MTLSSEPLVPIRFWRRGKIHEITPVSRHQTVLEYLRSAEGLNARGTKEGCAEGDCGACTIVLAEIEPDASPPRLKYRAINSCIRFTWQLDGLALWSVEDLEGEGLHPAQQALLDHHGSQCGFCTPGFVMSLFGLYQHKLAPEPGSGQADKSTEAHRVSRDEALAALSGNLCRCTGYRPILDAAQAMMQLPRKPQPDLLILDALQRMASLRGTDLPRHGDGIHRPATLASLLALRQAHPQAQLIAGATDVGLWVTKLKRRFEEVIDLSANRDLQGLRRIRDGRGVEWLEIGATVRLQDAFEALVRDRPHLGPFAHRFAGLPVRQSGTLGGNIANGSPIGDSMPLLMALGARIRLQSLARGEREMALEDFFVGYRKTQLAADEVLTFILVPMPQTGEISRVYKVSKRFEDDISAVCLGVSLRRDAQGALADVRIGVGGMAAIPSRARKTEARLRGAPCSLQSFESARGVLRDEFSPLDDMRASASYRREVIGNLLLRLWQDIEQPGGRHQLESMPLRPLPLDHAHAGERR